jgi:hypothetical protein
MGAARQGRERPKFGLLHSAGRRRTRLIAGAGAAAISPRAKCGGLSAMASIAGMMLHCGK